MTLDKIKQNEEIIGRELALRIEVSDPSLGGGGYRSLHIVVEEYLKTSAVGGEEDG